MNFASTYFTRYKALPPFFLDLPEEDLKIVIMIPCYDDPFIFETLLSLDHANPISSKFEVIVVVNSGERTPVEIIEKNRSIYHLLTEHAQTGYYAHFRLLPVWIEGTPKKKAGVGFARKVGLDEAVRRFAAIDRSDGLIVSLDADSLVDPNYLQVIEKAYHNQSASCFTFQFQHLMDASLFPIAEIEACKMYEIYLRYYRLALKLMPVPFAIHTIGSCFAIRADMYTKIGGMPVRQAGEDFYFLQKAVKMQGVCELNDRIVFPSPRISERVPFGTGASVRNIVASGSYHVYNFELFQLLRAFYESFPHLEHRDALELIPSEIMDYIGIQEFMDSIVECRKYSSSSGAFLKRMFDRFDAFFVIKFLNTFDVNSAYPPIDVHEAGKILLNQYGIEKYDNLYEQILALDGEL